jgi:hypothetical protein
LDAHEPRPQIEYQVITLAVGQRLAYADVKLRRR